MGIPPICISRVAASVLDHCDAATQALPLLATTKASRATRKSHAMSQAAPQAIEMVISPGIHHESLSNPWVTHEHVGCYTNIHQQFGFYQTLMISSTKDFFRLGLSNYSVDLSIKHGNQACLFWVNHWIPPFSLVLSNDGIRPRRKPSRLPSWVNLKIQTNTRRRVARERRGAESSVVSMETLYYKIIW